MSTENDQTTAAAAAPEATTETPATPELSGFQQDMDAEDRAGNGIADISEMLGLNELGSTEESKEEETKPEEAPAPEEVKAEEQPKPEEQKAEEGKKESLEDLLKQVLAERKQTEEPKKEEQPKQEQPFYKPVVPAELVEAMSADDPAVRQQALSIVVGGAMNRVRADMIKEMEGRFQVFQTQFPQQLQQQSLQQQEIRKQTQTFYDANPQFATTPERKKLVAMMGMQLAAELHKEGKYKGFTPEFQQQLAKQFSEATGIPAGKPAPAPKAEEKKEAKPKPVGFQAGGSPARSPAAGQPSLSDEIMDVVTFN